MDYLEISYKQMQKKFKFLGILRAPSLWNSEYTLVIFWDYQMFLSLGFISNLMAKYPPLCSNENYRFLILIWMSLNM